MINSDYIGDINRFSLITPTFYLNDIDNKKLSNELLSNAKRKSSDQISTFYEDFVADTKDCPTALELVNTVQDIVDNYYGNLEIKEWWSQIHQVGESSNQHNHFPAPISWAYWPKVPKGSGKFVFVMNDYASVMTEVDPVEGMLMFFPGWVMHKVTRNTSTDTRISISGNLEISKDVVRVR
jgi:hypothetical protein